MKLIIISYGCTGIVTFNFIVIKILYSSIYIYIILLIIFEILLQKCTSYIYVYIQVCTLYII